LLLRIAVFAALPATQRLARTALLRFVATLNAAEPPYELLFFIWQLELCHQALEVILNCILALDICRYPFGLSPSTLGCFLRTIHQQAQCERPV
jgi:hypothetical protein